MSVEKERFTPVNSPNYVVSKVILLTGEAIVALGHLDGLNPSTSFYGITH